MDSAYERAERKVKSRLSFYIHLAVFVVVMIFLIAINLMSNEQYFWAKWPLMGWGIGLIFHGLSVFVLSKSSSFTERMIEKELRKDEI